MSGLTEEERQRIVEEENLRAEIRKKDDYKKRSNRQVGCCLFVLIGGGLFLLFTEAFRREVNDNAQNVIREINKFEEDNERLLDFRECISDSNGDEAKEEICVLEYEDIVRKGYTDCKSEANQGSTEAYIQQELAECDESYSPALKYLDD